MVEGSCLCGNIRYAVEIMPDKIFNCHCKFCRKAHGADYATVAMAKGSTLQLIDEKGLLKEHQNDLGGFRAFCSECGSRLMNYASDKNMYFSVTLATVDTPLNLSPVAHANTESKASWCEPYAGIPQFSGFPDGLL
ncbi:GFA family protein [Oceanicoccus sp. KOV_DT_Chl]|uniref:GFA family protein n=1 Tax=Oceanicoccus sp. KOV_DT_Chl TaxID=1904639 RepID=UPI00190EE337|nr:GFA family protein [Oceanicoccus sp. KOV_DT_Chl]